MTLSEKYWEYVAQQLENSYGNGHPLEWTESVISSFLSEMEAEVKVACNDAVKAKLCDVPFIQGKYEVNQWGAIDTSTFRRIFHQGKTKHCKKKTKHQFAVYLGYDSFEDLINKAGIKKDAKVNSEHSVRIVESTHKVKKKNFPLIVLFILSVFTILLSIIINFDKVKTIKTLTEAESARRILSHEKPIMALIETASLDFNFDKTVETNSDEAIRFLKSLGVNKLTRKKDGQLYSGMINDTCEVTIWLQPYDYVDRYGIRFGTPDGSYFGSNDTYLEVIKK